MYRSQTCWFSPYPEYRITPTPIYELEYTDCGILEDPDNPVYYMVRAINDEGLESVPSNRVGGVSYTTNVVSSVNKKHSRLFRDRHPSESHRKAVRIVD